jgi:DNA-binding NtrC family response regulator
MLPIHPAANLDANPGAAGATTAILVVDDEPGFRLVITDDRMPGMSGYELVAVIARIHPRLRIVLMSGYSDAGEASSGQGGILRVLPKPFTASGLLGAVTDVLAEDQ